MIKGIFKDRFRGSGRKPPPIRAGPVVSRLAINVVANFEEGAEINVLDGDAYSRRPSPTPAATTMT